MQKVSGWTADRARAARELGKPPGAEGSVGKLAMSTIARLASLAHGLIAGADGMLTGPNFAAQEAMLNAGKFNVIASGGVSRREDVVKLAELARRYANLDGVIVGKALYEKRVELADLLAIAS